MDRILIGQSQKLQTRSGAANRRQKKAARNGSKKLRARDVLRPVWAPDNDSVMTAENSSNRPCGVIRMSSNQRQNPRNREPSTDDLQGFP
ncbi:hypothetical protein N8H74_21525 [Pseudomonas sp. B2M1-30]|uniref:Uncharacterized protein n=1 Tax=Pseudomonas koreensis TaxID=198620 RepID=A0A9X2XF97_9PSED|nr:MULTISPECIES: hypothetical protein [Pseudomonas]MBV4476718.1 hypothetical protein [Pseudomonas botevensis]MCU0120850.1 hypothetical protein [Pseudomonas sp. B2M1-30]MCU7248109.1 hypothetical protein [Pseudomonas koreensis]MCU7259961.1 hypothetical protein [Pseudomonas koreensis]